VTQTVPLATSVCSEFRASREEGRAQPAALSGNGATGTSSGKTLSTRKSNLQKTSFPFDESGFL